MADETKVVIKEDVLSALERKSNKATSKQTGLMNGIGLYKQAKDPNLTKDKADELIKGRFEGPLNRMDKWELKARGIEFTDGMTFKECFDLKNEWDKTHPEQLEEIKKAKEEYNKKCKGPLTDNQKRGLKDRGIPISEGMTYLQGRIAISKWKKENPEKEKELQEKYQQHKEAAGLDMTDDQILGLKIRDIEITEGMTRGEAAKAIHKFDKENPGVKEQLYEAYNKELEARKAAAKEQSNAETKTAEKIQNKPKAKIVSKTNEQSKSQSHEMSR